MATLHASRVPRTAERAERRFFLIMALVMALLNVAAFGMFAAMGISTFHAPLYVHVHALLFFGWVALYVAQNAFAASGAMALHRRLGWLGFGWAFAMILVGTFITVMDVRLGRVPFIFTPAYFLVMNPLNVLVFAGLLWAGIAVRRNTGWHRRLIYSAMATIMGPAFGRLLPPPILISAGVPVVICLLLAFIAIGALRDQIKYGRVHPAWAVGAAVQLGMWASISLIANSALGTAIYETAVAGSPAAHIPPHVKAPFPG